MIMVKLDVECSITQRIERYPPEVETRVRVAVGVHPEVHSNPN